MADAIPDRGLRPVADVLAVAGDRAGAGPSRWIVTSRPAPGARAMEAVGAERPVTFIEGGSPVIVGADADRVVAAVFAGDDRPLRRLDGDVAFVARNGDDLLAVRSAAGRVPVWWWASEDGACVGTRLAEVVAARRERRGPSAASRRDGALDPMALDPLAAAGFVGGQAAFPHNRSAIAGINMVPPGHVLHLPAEGAPTVRRWFDPWHDIDALGPPRRGRSFEEPAERFRAAVIGELARELDPAGGNLLTLSGGVDSSSLAFLAHDVGLPLAALSLVPDENDPFHGREMSFLEPLVDRTGIAPWWSQALTMEHRLEWLAAAPVAPLPVVHPALCLLPEVRSEWDGHVFVGGEFCDEVCGGAFAMVDVARTASPRELTEAVAHRVVGRTWGRRWLRYQVKGVPPVGPHRALPEVFRDDVREEWEQWRQERHAAVAASDKAHAYTIELLSSLDGAVAMNWEVCSSLGMRRVWPFLNRAVLEVVASLRPADLVVPVRKRLSRTAFRGTVPGRWLDRADDGSFGKERVFEPVSFGALPEELAALFRPEVVAGDEAVAEESSALAVGAGMQLVRSLRSLAG